MPLAFCQNDQRIMSVEEYIRRYHDIAVEEMKEFGIPASITLAQGIVESSNGNSELALNANNHFGIKCHKEWTGEVYYKDDDQAKECFRKYKQAEESFRDHSRFLRERDRYASLFRLAIADYRGWARGLKEAGYATNPRYPELLIKAIEDNKLYEFDRTPGIAGQEKPAKKPGFDKSTIQVSDNEDFEPVTLTANQRQVYLKNGIRCVRAKEGDQLGRIAKDLDMFRWQLVRYNDFRGPEKLRPGEELYLQPKKRKGPEDFHTVAAGETMRSISQDFGIKLRLLYKMNRMTPGSAPLPGQKLWLRKRKPA